MTTYLEKLRELEKGATEGPWHAEEMLHYGEPGTGFGWVQGPEREVMGEDSAPGFLDDAELIAFLRNTAAEVAAVLEITSLIDPECDCHMCGKCIRYRRLVEARGALDRRVKELQG